MYDYLNPQKIKEALILALQEDVGDGDHSSTASIPANVQNKAHLLVKDAGVLAGMKVAEWILELVDPHLQFTPFLQDGVRVQPSDIAFKISGSAHSILKAERLLLNCMQRMSGIATKTAILKEKIKHTQAQLLDTRKTTPNFRIFEKWAVKIGGGQNHRFGLFDAIMLKDNHIDFAGGIQTSLEATHTFLRNTGKNLPIIIEARTIDEVQEIIRLGGVSRILLDNMSPSTLREAILLVNKRFQTEASGGITEDTIVSVAETGVDYISVGALTHSYHSLDLSLKAF